MESYLQANGFFFCNFRVLSLEKKKEVVAGQSKVMQATCRQQPKALDKMEIDSEDEDAADDDDDFDEYLDWRAKKGVVKHK